MKRFFLTIIFFVLTLASLFSLVAAIPTRIPTLGLYGKAYRATGTVVKINHWTESSEAFTSPQVEFTTESGQKISVDMICPPLDCYGEYEIGSRVGVIYPSNFPEMAIADSLMGRLGTPLFMLVISLLFIGIGFAGLAVVVSDWLDGFKRLFKNKNHVKITVRNSRG
jgi:hypothetical protein